MANDDGVGQGKGSIIVQVQTLVAVLSNSIVHQPACTGIESIAVEGDTPSSIACNDAVGHSQIFALKKAEAGSKGRSVANDHIAAKGEDAKLGIETAANPVAVRGGSVTLDKIASHNGRTAA